MRIYEVRISQDALQDIARLRTFLLEMMSEDGAVRYANDMRAEIKMLPVFADLYRKTSSKTFLQIHPDARHMVSHNRRWDYVFHVEGGIIIDSCSLKKKMPRCSYRSTRAAG